MGRFLDLYRLSGRSRRPEAETEPLNHQHPLETLYAQAAEPYFSRLRICSIQRAQLESAGCEKVYIETASGAQRERPQLAEP